MTLPAAPPLSIAQIAAEFGIALPAVFPRDFYGKGGAPAAGALSFADFLGRSALGPAVYNPVPGDLAGDGDGSASVTITADRPVIWTWTRTSATGTSNVANGASAASITFSVIGGTSGRSAAFNVSADDGVLVKNWTVSLVAAGTGGTCVTTDSPVLMADGTEKPAGDLVVGDMVATYHEDTLEWGAFRVSAIEFAKDRVFAVPGHPVATYRHRFALPRSIARFLPGRARWWRAGWIGRDAGHGMVAKVTVDGAHTYMARNPAAGSKWRLSHNTKSL